MCFYRYNTYVWLTNNIYSYHKAGIYLPCGRQAHHTLSVILIILPNSFIIGKKTASQSLSNLPKITQWVSSETQNQPAHKTAPVPFTSLFYLGHVITRWGWKLKRNSWFQPSTFKFKWYPNKVLKTVKYYITLYLYYIIDFIWDTISLSYIWLEDAFLEEKTIKLSFP